MSATIQENKFTVLTAADGLEALQLAMKFVPSLVLTDLMMPRMNGMELTKKLKEDERTSHIPIILLTAKNESQSRLGALRTGADDYLTKPFSPDELLARITNLIEQRKKLAEKFRERILVPATISEDVSMDERFLHKVRTAVETNMSDYTFTVERLADEINLSRTQLLRKLKALTGLSPNDFIKDIRLKRASDMIRQRVDTITQIGYAVGFNDQSYFTKCFKKQFRLTPSEYLASQSPSNK
jgi:YesN/AraC family two-component response regulator